jgi:hypothetical protein
MKKNYLHTRFINYLVEKHNEEHEEYLQNLPEDELEEIPTEEESSQENPEEEYDEVIEKLLTEYRKTKREYENLHRGRK